MIGKLFIFTIVFAVAAAAPDSKDKTTKAPASSSTIKAKTTAKSADAKMAFMAFDRDVNPNDLSCDPNGQIFLLLPHFTDCNKFFMCTHGEEVLFSCAGPTIFDFHMQECNWPNLGTCTLRTLRDEEREGSGDNMIGMFADVLEQDAVDTMASSPLLSRFNGVLNCNRPDDAARQISYKGDCQRYWRCVGGIPQVVYCSDGLFFNESTQQCDFEANSKCNAVLPQDELQSEFIVYKD